MRKKIFKYFLVIVYLLFLTISIIPTSLNTQSVSAANYKDVCESEIADDELRQAFGCDEGKNSDPVTIVTSILRSIILVSGTVAVVFVVIGGVDIMTSAGDTNKIKKGRDTLLYAAIGLVVCALSYAIVTWFRDSVINKSINNPEETSEEVTLELRKPSKPTA